MARELFDHVEDVDDDDDDDDVDDYDDGGDNNDKYGGRVAPAPGWHGSLTPGAHRRRSFSSTKQRHQVSRGSNSPFAISWPATCGCYKLATYMCYMC